MAVCNCPQITPRTLREGIGTREPCPVHPDPDLRGIIFLPAVRDLRINTGPIRPYNTSGRSVN